MSVLSSIMSPVSSPDFFSMNSEVSKEKKVIDEVKVCNLLLDDEEAQSSLILDEPEI